MRFSCLTFAFVLSFCVLSRHLPGEDLAGLSVPNVELTLVDSEKAETTSLSAFRGKWLLLQFASTHDRDSETMGRLFRHIRESLQGRPFQYVQMYNDPTSADVRLFGAPAGQTIRTTIGRHRDMGILRPKSLPTWILADRNGIVRLSGGWYDPDAIRRQLLKVMSEDAEFSGVNLSASHVQALIEKAGWLHAEKKQAEGLAASEQVLAECPGNEAGLTYFTYCKNWTDGYTKTMQALDEKLRDRMPDEHLRLFQAIYQIIEGDKWSARETILQSAGVHSESLYLRALVLLFTKAPDTLSRPEEDLLVTGARTALDEHVRIYRAYVLQSAGRLEAAETLFRMTRAGGNLGMLPLVDNLARQGRLDEAWRVVQFESKGDPASASPREAWLRMHVATVVGDWNTAVAFAQRYQKVRPEKMQGILVEWLASRTQGKSRPDLQEKALNLAAHSDRYTAANALLVEGRLPGPGDIGKFSDQNLRYDTLLLFALLEWEKNGSVAARSLMTDLLPATNVSDWAYAVIEQLRGFTLKVSQVSGT